LARYQQDREDLLREATALVPRVELSVEGYQENIIIGFRKNGSLSIYFGPERVYHFNAQHQLRRAFIGGLLFKAEKGTLASLKRQRNAGQVQMLRHDLDQDETLQFTETAQQHLLRLAAALTENRFQLVGQVPTDTPLIDRIIAWSSALGRRIEIAEAPNVT